MYAFNATGIVGKFRILLYNRGNTRSSFMQYEFVKWRPCDASPRYHIVFLEICSRRSREFASLLSLVRTSELAAEWDTNVSWSRWFVANGRIDKVVQKLRRIAKVNKRSPDTRVYEVFVVSKRETRGLIVRSKRANLA